MPIQIRTLERWHDEGKNSRTDEVTLSVYRVHNIIICDRVDIFDDDVGEAGTWIQEGSDHFFHTDFTKCKVGEFFVGVGDFPREDDPNQFQTCLCVGKVKTTDGPTKSFQKLTYNCTIDPWKSSCLHGQWNYSPSSNNNDNVVHNENVIMYFKKLNNTRKLPSNVIRAVEERDLLVEESSESESDYSH
jgi:hypothetical protein